MKKYALEYAVAEIDSRQEEHRPRLLWALVTGFIFWVGLIGIILWLGVGFVSAEPLPAALQDDPMVMKIYPDGTKVVVRWSDVGKQLDNGEKYGGAPRIVAYDPAKDGIVPISEPSSRAGTASSTNAPAMGSGSVVTPEQPAKIDYSQAGPEDPHAYAPTEGFVIRSAVGVAFQQPLSGRNGDGSVYTRGVFQPGIRFDLEPGYNVIDWFRVGLESSFIYNQLHSLQTDDNINYGPNGPSLGNGGLYQIPMMANVRFQFPSDTPYRGYVGGSFGGSWDVLQSSNLFGTYTSYSWNYCYGLTTGFTYTITQGLDLDFSYKLLATLNPNFADSGSYKNIYNHAAEIGLAWRF